MASSSTPTPDPIPLPARFALIKRDLIAGKEAAVTASWTRLLQRLQAEIDLVAGTGSAAIPCIDFSNIHDPASAAEFSSRLRQRGAAVIRNVVPKDVAARWRTETMSYIADNPSSTPLPTRDPHLFGVYWSPAQVKGRAHANVLTAQRFLMSLWRSDDESALASPNYPVSYADRLRIRSPGNTSFYRNAHVDGGSVERWEPDGYGQGSTYGSIWDGNWEGYDPWESSSRLRVTSDLYSGAGACSMFRMFQGWLSLSPLPPGGGTLLLCPMVQLSTAYLLLRPFFTPVHGPGQPGFLSPENWVLESPPSSVIHGALPSYTQELNRSLHPHLDLPHSMVPLPALEPGDYAVWHPDAVYAIDRGPRGTIGDPSAGATVMYLPACPLTQTNALYLARQRKAFLLGQPSPDFGGGRGESGHMGRPGVQEISDAGGEDGLRAMGLLPWEEEDAMDDLEAEVMEMANNILFPDRYDLD